MRICIVGAGDGGATAASQIRRLDDKARIDVFTSRGTLGCPPCEMPLVIGGEIATWDELVRGFRQNSFWEKRGIDLHLGSRITGIDRQAKQVVADGKRYEYDKLILALGAIPVVPPLAGLDGNNEFTLSTDMADGIAFDNAVRAHSEAAVVGGGFLALEIASALKTRGYRRVYLLVRQRLLRATLDEDMAEKLHDLVRKSGVELVMPARIESVGGKQGKKLVRLSDRELEADLIFLAAGSKPDVELARKAGLKIGETGAIEVNHHLQTSDPDIYAVGDCMENWDTPTESKRRHQSAMNAIRTGYIAGRNAAKDNYITYQGTVMPFVTKVFNHQVGSVGLTETQAGKRGMHPVSVTLETARLRERFDGRPAHYRLIADAKTEVLLGAQLMSEEIVCGTIDKLAVAIACRMPVIRLVQCDSCYSPGVREDQLAIPLHRLIDMLERGK